MRKLIVWKVAWCLWLFPAAVSAGAPGFVPLQGYLTDASGQPIEGQTEITLSLYEVPSGSERVFFETHHVLVEGGLLSAYLGTQETLDLALFRDHLQLYLGVRIGQEAELTPRIRVGITPFAAYAEYAGDAQTLEGHPASDFYQAGDRVDWSEVDVPSELAQDDDTLAALACPENGVAKSTGSGWSCGDDAQTPPMPPGSIMFFEGYCPVGWRELPQARGYAIVGLPAGGTPLGTVGAALGDAEDRTHDHTVDPGPVDSSSVGPHSHSVNPPNATSNPGGHHVHEWSWATYASSAAEYRWYSYDSSGNFSRMMTWSASDQGHGQAGSGIYPFSIIYASADPWRIFYTSGAGEHTHDLNLPAITSSRVNAHSHPVNLGAVSSSTANTADVMPYVQLRVCVKD